MRNLIFIMAILLTVVIACNEDPLGLDENVKETLIGNDSTENPQDTNKIDTVIIIKKDTRVRAESVEVNFSEFIVRSMQKDTITQRWTALLTEARAIIDTSGDDFLYNLLIVSQRDFEDEINPMRKEYILGFSLELDSVELDKKYFYNKINRFYKSVLKVWYIKEKRIVTFLGEYPIILYFNKTNSINEIKGEFTIEVPTNTQMNHYNYYFKGEISISY